MRARKFDVGQLRHRVAIYSSNRVSDGAGGFDRSDPSGADLIGCYWCNIQPVTARERQWGEQFTEQTTHTCWLRYNVLIKEGMTLTRTVGDTLISYYLEGLFDPDNMMEWYLLTLREGGPL